MAFKHFRRAREIGVAALLSALLLSGCAVTPQPTATVQPIVQATILPATAIPPILAPGTTVPPMTTPLPTLPPAATALPTVIPPTPAPAQPMTTPPLGEWTNFVGAGRRWSINYPANTLTPLDMGGGLIVFISQDRGYFLAVDSRPGVQNGDPAALRVRAAEALTQIYVSRPATIIPLSQTDTPWQTGVSFATTLGSEGTAAYYNSAEHGVPWVYGTLYGYRAGGSSMLRETLYQSLATLQLTPLTDGVPVTGPQDPDAAATALVGLLDALMRDGDPMPFLAQPLIEASANGQPYTRALGLSADPLQDYSVATPSQTTGLEGSLLVSATLHYPGRSETWTFNVVAEGAAWKVYSTIVP